MVGATLVSSIGQHMLRISICSLVHEQVGFHAFFISSSSQCRDSAVGPKEVATLSILVRSIAVLQTMWSILIDFMLRLEGTGILGLTYSLKLFPGPYTTPKSWGSRFIPGPDTTFGARKLEIRLELCTVAMSIPCIPVSPVTFAHAEGFSQFQIHF
ncbi:hypothetical protein BDZ91DRAFT_741216 [Kalaharituber pfeilii]|nr:hypothetical protein BDZ91DRAFT_741216 [Kalaharituber pfeilii]